MIEYHIWDTFYEKIRKTEKLIEKANKDIFNVSLLRGETMPYSELIKNFDRIRDYLRDFYVYGFKRRDEYDTKSARSYDNERRRVESWLREYMSFRQDSEGKRIFISIDSSDIKHNPLYKAFKAKSFTSKDIMLNFFILDALLDDTALTAGELTEIIENDYLSVFDSPVSLDEATVRLKLKEYEKLGLLISEKEGKQLRYSRIGDCVPLSEWKDALAYYSEENPLGVVGSYLLDKLTDIPDYYRYKHHYMLHALESEVLFDLLIAIGDNRRAEIFMFNPKRGGQTKQIVTPLRIVISTQSGRRYLMAYSHKGRRINLFRLDTIRKVEIREIDDEFKNIHAQSYKFIENMWGVSSGLDLHLDHIEFTIYAGENEKFIVDRLNREKRCGTVESAGVNLYHFKADVYDVTELLPWIRTFIGRIVSFDTSSKYTWKTFHEDLEAMYEMYNLNPGGVDDVVS